MIRGPETTGCSSPLLRGADTGPHPLSVFLHPQASASPSGIARSRLSTDLTSQRHVGPGNLSVMQRGRGRGPLCWGPDLPVPLPPSWGHRRHSHLGRFLPCSFPARLHHGEKLCFLSHFVSYFIILFRG